MVATAEAVALSASRLTAPRRAPHILMHVMSRRLAVLMAAAIALAHERPIAQADAFFSFHSNAWLNLHHILWSKGEGAPLAADTPEPERSAWAAGIELYAPYSKRDLVFIGLSTPTMRIPRFTPGCAGPIARTRWPCTGRHIWRASDRSWNRCLPSSPPSKSGVQMGYRVCAKRGRKPEVNLCRRHG